MIELIKYFFESSKERIKNPLIGALAFSWFFINWKIVFVILFSKQTIENKITHIESNYIEFCSNYIYPIGFALIYLIILPYILQCVEWLIKKSVLARKSNITDMLVKDIKGKERIARHINVLEKFKADNKSLIELNRKIKELENENESLKNNVLDLENKISRLKPSQNESKTSDNFDEEYSKFKKTDLFETFNDVGLGVAENEQFPIFTNAMDKQKYISHGILEETIKPGERNHSILFTNKGVYFWNKYVLEPKSDFEMLNDLDKVQDIDADE
jgi:hypothetical protein